MNYIKSHLIIISVVSILAISNKLSRDYTGLGFAITWPWTIGIIAASYVFFVIKHGKSFDKDIKDEDED
jgi:hypothetical protein